MTPPTGPRLTGELWQTQVESITGVCTDLRGLRAHLTAGRARLAAAARAEGAHLVSVGQPLVRDTAPMIADSAHYAGMRALYHANLTEDEMCGTHVHVGVPDRETGVAVLNFLTPWLPTLLALTTNSPYRRGFDTGFHSWRMVAYTALPAAGMPPWFASAADYDADAARLAECGVWKSGHGGLRVARLSAHLPTVEVRVADACATIDDAVLYAGLVRALVRTALTELRAGRTAQPLDPQVTEAALWSAARFGLHGPGIDPWQARQVPAVQLVDDLTRLVRDALTELGDTEVIHPLLKRAVRDGTSASQQRAAARTGGLPAVLNLLTTQTLAGVPAVPEQASTALQGQPQVL